MASVSMPVVNVADVRVRVVQRVVVVRV